MNESLPRVRGLAPVGAVPAVNTETFRELEPFTDAQVDEFREQDRWLPVSPSSARKALLLAETPVSIHFSHEANPGR